MSVFLGGCLAVEGLVVAEVRGEQGGPAAEAFAQAASGRRLVQREDYQRAEQAFAKAMALLPNEPTFPVERGLAFMRLSKEEQAVEMFERAIQLEPGSTGTHVLLADLRARRGDWSEAIRHYETAVRQDPSSVRLEEKLRSARVEYRAEHDLDHLYTTHVVVKFLGTTDGALAHEASEYLEDVVATIGQEFGYVPVHPVTVVLYPGRRFQEVTGNPSWAHALFDGTIRLSAEKLKGNMKTMRASLRHEYGHALVQDLSGGRAPSWLSEGLAQYWEGGPMIQQAASPARDPGATMPLHALHGSFTGFSLAVARQAYADSYAATTALIARYGLGRVRELLASLSADVEFARAFERVFHERYPDFEATWMRTPNGGRS
jgi:tetratricopeptide (TPR) repeat protein